MNNSSSLMSLFIYVYCSAACAAERPDAFLENYRTEIEKLTTSYGHIHLSARIEERVGSKVGNYDVELFLDGSNIKTAKRYVSGDKLSQRAVTVTVANKEKSFILNKSREQQPFSMELLGHHESDYARTHQKTELEARVIRAPFFCIGVPFVKFLTMKETKIINVAKGAKGDEKDTCRIDTRTAPFSKDFEGWCDYIEGSFLFEPTSHWALRKYTLKYWDKTGQPRTSLLCSINYEKPVKDIPVLRSVRYDVYDGKGNLARGYHADVQFITFGSIAPEEFTLRGCGFTGDSKRSPGRQRIILFLSGGIVILALILIVILRRRIARKRQTTGYGGGGTEQA